MVERVIIPEQTEELSLTGFTERLQQLKFKKNLEMAQPSEWIHILLLVADLIFSLTSQGLFASFFFPQCCKYVIFVGDILQKRNESKLESSEIKWVKELDGS